MQAQRLSASVMICIVYSVSLQLHVFVPYVSDINCNSLRLSAVHASPAVVRVAHNMYGFIDRSYDGRFACAFLLLLERHSGCTLASTLVVAIPLATMASGTTTRWFLAECPLNEECSAAAWGRTKGCQSFESEGETRKLALKHFTDSAKHWHRELDDLTYAANVSEVKNEQCPSHWFALPSSPKSPKDKKRKASRSPLGRKMPSRAPVGASTRKRIGDAGSSSTAVARPSSSTSTEEVTMSKKTLLGLISSTDRALSAVRHAVQITSNARAAFEEEANRLDAAKAQLQQLLLD
jgi:hypothetical protein